MRFRPFWWWGQPTTMIEVASGWMLLVIGVQLALPFDSFASNPAFKGMETMLPSEAGWAAICIFAGMLTSAAVCGRIHDLRPTAARLNMGIWAFLSVSWFNGSPQGLAFLLYGILALLTFWVVMKGPTRNGVGNGGS